VTPPPTTALPMLPLAGGTSMPQLGLGVWQMSDTEAEAAAGAAIDVGYRLVDTAAAYGNEEGVGRALRAASVARDDVFVTTKLWIGSYASTTRCGPARRASPVSGSTASTCSCCTGRSQKRAGRPWTRTGC